MLPRFLACFVLAALVMVFCHGRTLARRDRFPAEDDLLYLPKVEALKILSLGHHELSATLVFIRCLVYFGGEITSKEKKFSWMDNYLDTIVKLDPMFELAYRWAGTATIYNGRTITNEGVARANHYLKLGAERFPRAWIFPWMIGCNYMFEYRQDQLPNKTPEEVEAAKKQKEEWQRIGADWVRQAALVGSAPPWASLLAAQLMRKEGKTEASIRYLEEVYLTTTEENTRDEIRRRLISLRGELVDQLKSRSADFEAKWKATLPYAPPDFFVILGEPKKPRMDTAFLMQDLL